MNKNTPINRVKDANIAKKEAKKYFFLSSKYRLLIKKRKNKDSVYKDPKKKEVGNKRINNITQVVNFVFLNSLSKYFLNMNKLNKKAKFEIKRPVIKEFPAKKGDSPFINKEYKGKNACSNWEYPFSAILI